MSRGKHSYDDEFEIGNFPWKTIAIVILVIIVIIGVFFGGRYAYSSLDINEKLSKKSEKENTEKEITIEEQEMPTNLYGYNVLGKLLIESKGYSKYILDIDDNNSNSPDNVLETNETESLTKALKKGIVKLYGNNINSIGNFCIIGHNEKEMFSVLNELKENDIFEIEDTKNNKNKYVITKIYTVEPTDLNCLMPNNEFKEVTLITCTTGSNQRLVIKALEENDFKLSKNQDNTISKENTDNENLNQNNSVE